MMECDNNSLKLNWGRQNNSELYTYILVYLLLLIEDQKRTQIELKLLQFISSNVRTIIGIICAHHVTRVASSLS